MYTVEQVHADFYSAEERLLNEAKELLKDPQLKKAQYAERVSKLGFTSAKPVKEATDMAQAYKRRLSDRYGMGIGSRRRNSGEPE